MKVAVLTYGCSVNKADSAIIRSFLRRKGHEIVSEDAAELVIVNTCVVKSPTENKILKKLSSLKNKKVVVAGCMAQVMPEKIREKFPEYGVLGVEAVDNVVSVVEGLVKEDIRKKHLNKAGLNRFDKNEQISVAEISEGCLGNCAYCIVKKARGTLHSYPLKDILDNVRKGRIEVWLTSQDNGCYGFDINTDLSELLNEINELDKKILVRVGMMNPRHAYRILNKLVRSFDSDKIFKFIHVPVQSGSNRVLKSMNRQYSVKTFERVVKAFRNRFERITVATDIIAGYPAETEEDFQKSLRLVKKVKPDITNISMYWERPGTKAAELKQWPNRIRKNRSRSLTKLCAEISGANNKKWMDWKGEVFVDEKGKGNTFIGRNYAYKPVVLKNVRLGEFVNVKIKETATHYLIGSKIR